VLCCLLSESAVIEEVPNATASSGLGISKLSAKTLAMRQEPNLLGFFSGLTVESAPRVQPLSYRSEANLNNLILSMFMASNSAKHHSLRGQPKISLCIDATVWRNNTIQLK
jgi:hypothetical protein